jgi:hypothetical protein
MYQSTSERTSKQHRGMALFNETSYEVFAVVLIDMTRLSQIPMLTMLEDKVHSD